MKILELGVAVCAAMTLIVIASLDSATAQQSPPPTKGTTLLRSTVSGEPNKMSVLMLVELPAGATTGRHAHPGDEYAIVLEGELELNVEGQPARKVVAGEGYHNPAGVTHETRNITAAPAKVSVVFVVDKDKPIRTPK